MSGRRPPTHGPRADLQALYRAAIDRYRDASAYDAVLAREREDVQRLREVRA